MELNVINFSNELEENLRGLSMVYKESKEKILKIGILTNIAIETMPNYKNYKMIISGISQARMIKGVSGRNAINSQLRILFQTYNFEEVNNNIIERAMDLMIMTFDSVYSKSGKKIQKKYRDALESVEFLYMNLRLAVKIIAESLRLNNIELTNKTLHFMTDAIKKEKKNIAEEYISAYISGDEGQLQLARKNYRETMERMLNHYISSLKIPFETAKEVGKELQIVETLGKDFLDLVTAYFIKEVKERIQENKQIQLILEF